MKNPILSDNLELVPAELKSLLPKVDDEFGLPASISIAVGKRGLPVAQVHYEKQKIHTNSLNDPWDEAARWAETLDYKDVMVSFIYGCGFGYPLLEYYRRKKPYTETIIFEQNIDLFYTMLSRIDIRPLLKDSSVHFVIGNLAQMKPQFESWLTAEFLLRATKPAAFFTWLAHRNEKAAYLELHELVWNTLELHLSAVGNSVHDTLVGMYNIVDNVEYAANGPRLSLLHNAFSGKPAFIVANGPSLDKNIELLTGIAGKALIFTAESALRPCLQRNIRPDGVCVTERTPNVYHIHFENENLPPELVLIGLTLMDPRIARTFPGPWVPVFRSGESTGKWVQQAISTESEGLHGGGSSAHLAFEFALWLGANPIIFVGQDLAFGPNKATHSRMSAYSDAELQPQVEWLQTQPTYFVPGVNGDTVLTTKTWYEFKTWFEQQIALHPETHFIDATEGGAYIQGTEVSTLRDAIDTYCHDTDDLNFSEFVTCCVSQVRQASVVPKLDLLLDSLKDIQKIFGDLSEAAKEDIRNCKLVEKACSLQQKLHGTALPPFVETLFQKNSDAFRKYAVDENVVPFTQQVIFAFHKQITDVGEVDTVERLQQVTALQRKMLEYIRKSCLLVQQHFHLAESRVKNLQH